MAEDRQSFVVTPWEVKGTIDYDRLVRVFGLKLIDESLRDRLQRRTGQLHFMLRRGIFFAHRDLDWILDEYERGKRFYLYTGRGPSGHTHIAHLIPWIFTRHLQEKFGAKVYFQLTDDEKFLFKENLDLEETRRMAYENALDFIALGFDPKKTFIFLNTEYAKTLYREALKVARHITFSTTRAVFGFTNQTNVGEIFYTSMQAVPAFLESVKEGQNVPCLIPHGVDQDPHFRVTRDILPKLGYYKPAQIEAKLLPGLLKGGKMSTSDPRTAIFTTDGPEEVEEKIRNAFTGGRDTASEQRKRGADVDVCTVCNGYFRFLFEEDEAKFTKLLEGERKGRTLCGELKEELTNRIIKFLGEHQRRREKARNVIEKFMLKD